MFSSVKLIGPTLVNVPISQRVRCHYMAKTKLRDGMYFLWNGAEYFEAPKGLAAYCLLVPGAGIEPARAF